MGTHRSERDRHGTASLGAVRAIVSSLIAIALPACAHDTPTAPSATPAPAASHSVAQAPEHAGFGDALADASGRLLPSVKDAVARSELDAALRDLSAEVDAGDMVQARTALARARKAVAANAKLSGAEPADLAAIGVTLDRVEGLLNSASATIQP